MNKFKFLLLSILMLSTMPTQSTAANKSRKALAIGKVTSITTGNLYIKKKNDLLDLNNNDDLHLGNTVIAGEDAKATLKFSRPKGVSKDTNLIFIQPIPGEDYIVNVKLENNNDGSIQATINP